MNGWPYKLAWTDFRAIVHVAEHGASSMGKDVSEDVIYILQRNEQFAEASTMPADRVLSRPRLAPSTAPATIIATHHSTVNGPTSKRPAQPCDSNRNGEQ